MRTTGLRELEEWVLSGAEYASLIVREAACDPHDGELIKDIAALANTAAKKQRFVVFGVSKVADGVELRELTEADHAQGARYERVTAKYFEPQLRLKYIRWRVRSKSLGVLLIDNCEDGPYLIRKDALPFVQVGDAWIRRRQRSVRMRRSELDRIYSARFAGPLYDGHVRVQFAGNTPSEFIRLKTTDSQQLPSKIAAEKIAALIGAREMAMRSATNEMTYIGRLSQARIMGCGSAYDEKGVNTLKLELKSIAETFRTEDERYRLEQQSHSVNLQLALDGDCDIECASLVLHFPAHIGLDIAEDAGFNSDRDARSGKKPHVEISGDVIRVSENYERLTTKRLLPAFGQPLRMVIDSRTAGHKIPIHYRIHGRNLRFPVSGKLYIICAA